MYMKVGEELEYCINQDCIQKAVKFNPCLHIREAFSPRTQVVDLDNDLIALVHHLNRRIEALEDELTSMRGHTK